MLHEVQFYRIVSLVDKDGHKCFIISPIKGWADGLTGCVWGILRLTLVNIIQWK